MTARLTREILTKNQAKYNIFTSIRDVITPRDSKQALGGLVAAVKDNIVTTEEPTTCSSQMLRDFRSPFSATLVSLLEDSGARIIGKTNLDEFGMGSATIHSAFGPTLNPLYPGEQRVSGGSSGGSAAAVAADLVDFSIGTDTGGSVRLPASYCGIVGFKPSYGRISRWGVIAYAQSLDTVGILAKSVDTVAKVFQVLDRPDANDPTCLGAAERAALPEPSASSGPMRIGVLQELNLVEISQEVRDSWTQFLLHLHAQGHEIVNVSVPVMESALPAYYTLAPAEASSNLARYDGVRYGHRAVEDHHGTTYSSTRTEGFGVEVQRRIVMGTYNLSSEAYGNHFIKAQAVRQSISEGFDTIFSRKNVLSTVEPGPDGLDFVVSPSAMTSAPLLDSFKDKEDANPVNSYVNDVLTVPASLAGIPAISIPWKPRGAQVPIGVQIMGQYGDDANVLQFAQRFV